MVRQESLVDPARELPSSVVGRPWRLLLYGERDRTYQSRHRAEKAADDLDRDGFHVIGLVYKRRPS